MKCLVNNRMKGIIFDLDGVLVQAKEWHREAVHNALESFGYEVDPKLCYESGKNTRYLLKELSKHGKCPADIEAVWRKKQEETKKVINRDCKRVQRIFDVVEFAHKEMGGNIALATNCSRETAKLILENLEIDVFFKLLVTSGDVNAPKPSATPYLHASYGLGIYPNKCLAIDDSSIGIQSAMEAGCRFIRLDSFETLTVESLKKILKKLEIRI